MTILTAGHRSELTQLEQLLLAAAGTTERFVRARLERRAARRDLHLVRAQDDATRVRRDAVACGGLGILPR